MDAGKLASRLQEILKERRGGTVGSPPAPVVDQTPSEISGRALRTEPPPTPAEVLGATELSGPRGRCLAVERRHEAYQRHGRVTIEDYAAGFVRHVGAAPLVAPELSGLADGLPEGLLFFDLETTGLAGGAGTYAFLIGCAWFDRDTLVTRQYFLPDYDVEDAVLAALAELVSGSRAVVSYNGRAFDVPLIETRYQLNRMISPFTGRPHLDMLPPARRLWKRRERGERNSGAADGVGRAASARPHPSRRPGDDTSCALSALEVRVLGLSRTGDVPGAEIPARYFNYLRSRDATMLVDVFEHNRLDLVSLAALTSTALRLVDGGPEQAPTAGECVALGRLYDQAGRYDVAETCFRRGAGLDQRPFYWDEDEWARVEALYHLARRLRRARRYGEAAEVWHRLIHDGPCPAAVAREAAEALAIHHEHRARDLEAARTFALRALDHEHDPARRREVRYRLDRLERKLGVRFGWEDER